ncbi:extracellular solute-binding protein [Micrococcaceae bacterium Sec5.1]
MRWFFIAVCGLMMLTACGSGGAGSAVKPDSGPSTVSAKTLDEAEWSKVVDSANKEGQVTVYGVLNAKLVTILPEAFHKAYPDITVKYVRLSPADIEARLNAEIASGNATGDVFDNLANNVVDKMADTGKLVPLALPELANPEFDRKVNQRTPYSAYISQTPYAWAWNTKLLPEGIHSWGDFLKLKSSLLGVTDPSIGPAVVGLYQAMEQPQTGGEGFLDKLFSQGKPQIYAGSNPQVAALGAGEVAALLPVPLANVLAAKDGGAPVDFSLYDGSYTIPAEVGVLEGSPHPNAAQVYANWLLSEDGQKALAAGGIQPIVKSVPPRYDSKGIEFVMDKPLPPKDFTAFQQRWAKMLAK